MLLYAKASRKTAAQLLAVEIGALFRLLRHKLDPLDQEILERTFDATLAAVKGDESPVDFDSDEALEAILRRELIEIAYFSGVSDPETLRDLLLDRLPPVKAGTDGRVKVSRRRKSSFPARRGVREP